jgi:hypothetical protein
MNPLLIKALPYIGGALVLGGALWWAYDNGRDAERAKWQQKEAVATLKARERENALQAQVDAAGAALSVSTAQIERLTQRATGNVRTIYATRPADNLACLNPDVLRVIAESDQAADNPGTASTGPR